MYSTNVEYIVLSCKRVAMASLSGLGLVASLAIFIFAWLQGEEIVRRCLYGYSPELALQTSNPINIPPGKGGKSAGSGSVRITSEHVRNLKHDVEFIKKAHDLRDVGEGKRGKGNAKVALPRYRQFARLVGFTGSMEKRKTHCNLHLDDKKSRGEISRLLILMSSIFANRVRFHARGQKKTWGGQM